MFLYGISLRHGWGCRSNTYLAFQYLQTAAEHAIKDVLHDSLASKGELIMAIYELGVSFQQGWGVAKNKETAFYYFEIAAKLGDLDAMNELAFCYVHGHGVKKDIYKAAKYYRIAARQGQEQIGNSWIWKQKYDIVDE
jgi:TPR repeat protein